MVDEIYSLKNRILAHIEDETTNMNRIDVKEIGELVDMVKDLAEAEKYCWEATYYRSISQAMETYEAGQRGYEQPRQPAKVMGSSPHDDIIGKLEEEYRNLTQEERLMMKSRVLNVLGSM